MMVSIQVDTTSKCTSPHQFTSSDVLQQEANNDGEDESSSSSSSSSSSDSENKEETSLLLPALSALAKLAALETSKYQMCVRRRSPKHNNSNHHQSKGDDNDGDDADDDNGDDNEASSTILSLDQVVVELDDSSIQATRIVDFLAQSIHRLHSNISVLQSESDQQADEIQQLQQLVLTLQKRNQDLEQTIQSLNLENQKLVGKLKRKAKEKKCLVDHVKTFLRQVQDSEEQQKELEELREAYKLQAHESFLLLQHSNNNRSRTASTDSNLSDGLDFLHSTTTAAAAASDNNDHSNNDLMMTTTTTTTTTMMMTTAASDESESSVYSLVTDACAPTLKLESPSGNTVSSSESHTTLDSWRSSSTTGAAWLHPIPLLSSNTTPATTTTTTTAAVSNKPYTLNFPRGTKAGILIKQLELHQAASVVVAAAAVATTTTTNPKPNRHLTNALMESNQENNEDNSDSSSSSSDKQSANGKEQQQQQQHHHHHFGLPFNINPFKGQQQQQQQQQQQSNNSNKHNKQQSQVEQGQPKHAFIVSGYGDFNESLNTKPTLGARIIAINQVPIPETCTLDELMESLHASSLPDLLEDDKNDATYSVTFRNDPLTRKQREMLGIVVAAEKQEQEEEEKESWTKSVVADMEPTTVGATKEGSDGKEDPQNKAPGTGNNSTQEPPQNKHKAGFSFGFMKMGNHLGDNKKRSAEITVEDANTLDDKNKEDAGTKKGKQKESSTTTPGEETEPTLGATDDGLASVDQQSKASVPNMEESQNQNKGFNFGFMKMGNHQEKKRSAETTAAAAEEEEKTSVNKDEEDAGTKNEKRKNGNKNKVFGFWNQDKSVSKGKAQEASSSSTHVDNDGGEVDDDLV